MCPPVALPVQLLLAAVIAGCGVAEGPTVHATNVPSLHPSVDGYAAASVALESPDGDVHVLAVRVASTPAERQHGLMEVPLLPDGSGMLFTFDGPRRLSFWMKDTLVPLDLAAVAATGEITGVVAMEPCGEQPVCPTYSPDGEAVAGLETPQGWLAEVGAGVGWTVCVREGEAPPVPRCDGV